MDTDCLNDLEFIRWNKFDYYIKYWNPLTSKIQGLQVHCESKEDAIKSWEKHIQDRYDHTHSHIPDLFPEDNGTKFEKMTEEKRKLFRITSVRKGKRSWPDLHEKVLKHNKQ
tara:strand:+ start:199 stop:534 length:336 start_codon:yes stop_codon:yes gene_type:complete